MIRDATPLIMTLLQWPNMSVHVTSAHLQERRIFSVERYFRDICALHINFMHLCFYMKRIPYLEF